MKDHQFTEILKRLDRVELLLTNLQPKKRPRQTKIVETRSLEEQMKPFRGRYAPSLLRDFWLYWSQRTPSGRERWQLEKVFDIAKRLETWRRKEEKWQWEREQKALLKNVDEKPGHRTRTDS